jgi:DNA-binding NarL/FixJ family response regulator
MRVVIADDAVLFREGLARVLEAAGIHVAGQVGDAEQLLARVRAEPPDTAVVDIRMPPTHTREGLDAARRIRAEHPRVGVLVLSQYVEPHHAIQLLRTAPAASATCSRTASPTSARWSTPCAASPAAGR